MRCCFEMLAPGETSELDQCRRPSITRNYTAYGFPRHRSHHLRLRTRSTRRISAGASPTVCAATFSPDSPSRRFEQRFTGDDFKLYRALRSINPSLPICSISTSGLPHFRLVSRNPLPHRRPPAHRPHCRNHEAHRRCRAGRPQCPVPARRPQRERRTRDACGPCPQRPLPQPATM